MSLFGRAWCSLASALAVSKGYHSIGSRPTGAKHNPSCLGPSGGQIPGKMGLDSQLFCLWERTTYRAVIILGLSEGDLGTMKVSRSPTGKSQQRQAKDGHRLDHGARSAGAT